MGDPGTPGEFEADTVDATSPVARRRRRVLIAVVVLAVAVALGGLAASTTIRSPADEAADAAPPEPTLMTAEVTSTVVREVVVLRGTVTAASEYEVTPVAGEGATQVVTAPGLSAGSPIAEGDVLVEVSGRPLIALGGGRPAYRDLTPGLEGPDVAQLQAALTTLGLALGDDDPGVYGSETKRAVGELYEARGYAPSIAGDPGAVEAARRQVDVLDEQIDDLIATAGTTQADVDAAETELDAARGALAALERATGPQVPLSEHTFLPSFPGVVVSTSAQIGAAVEAPLLVVAAGALVVEGRLNQADAGLVRAEMPAAISGADVEVTGVVTSVGGSSPPVPTGDGEGAAGATPSGTAVAITPDEPIPPAAVGADVEVTITAAASPAEVLAVPVAAVSVRADGKTYVTVVHGGGDRASVEITTGLSGGGLVEISPVDGEVRPGDRVVTSG